MNNVVNRDINRWIRPWNKEKFDDLYNRDDRFFAIVVKGLMSWLNRNIMMYDKGINHFILNTGSSYLYIENNGYEYSWNETTGEDMMYMSLPRCVMTLEDISIPQEELTSPFSRGIYERIDDGEVKLFNAEMRRLPINMSVTLNYVLSNFNEYIILVQELIEKIIFQKYFNITYLGQIIQCSIEYPDSFGVELNKIDMSNPEPNQKTVTLQVTINTNYPIINERSEIPATQIISYIGGDINIPSTGPISSFDSSGSRKVNIYNFIRFDINNNYQIDSKEINIANTFINIFDLDGDNKVDKHDIMLIIQTFIGNVINFNMYGDYDYDVNLVYNRQSEEFTKIDFNNIIHYFSVLDVDGNGEVTEGDINLYLEWVNFYINIKNNYEENNLIIKTNDDNGPTPPPDPNPKVDPVIKEQITNIYNGIYLYLVNNIETFNWIDHENWRKMTNI